ncbi:MAG: 2-phosphosulfolactate phosphatase [Chloroflexota bacterium]
MYFDQRHYDVRCEWGLQAITQLGALADVLIIIDTLSFTTCVDIAVGRGAIVYPYRWRDAPLNDFAASIEAVVAGASRGGAGFTLSPASLLGIEPGTKLVLPSPNGSALSLAVDGRITFAGCIRNAKAVARAAEAVGSRILVVPAGERWPDHTLRPGVEDMLGAGAIIHYLGGTKSPEAAAAEAVYLAADGDIEAVLQECSSGRKLIERGFSKDVEIAAQLNVSKIAPKLIEGAYR